MAWTPLPDGVWMCMTCWAPRDAAEEREYRRENAVPSHPSLECSFCGRLPSPEAIMCAAAREQLKRESAAAASVAAGAAPPQQEKASPRRPIDPSKDLLRLSETARALGIDRKTTLANLIADRHVRTVPAPRGPRVPRSEVDRLLREGIPQPAVKKRRSNLSARGESKVDDVTGIRNIKID